MKKKKLFSIPNLMGYARILMAVKEGYMAVMGAIKLKKYGKKLDGAMWYGKVCTALLFVVMFLLIAIPKMSCVVVNGLIGLCMLTMIYTLVRYAGVFAKM